MSSSQSRRRILRRVGAAFVLGGGLAGCLGEPSSETEESNSTSPLNTTTEQTTIPPADVSDEDAKKRVFDAEKQFLESRLQNASCLESWGATPSTASKEATVVKRSAAGVTVQVTHPYWYSTNNTEADTSSDARYLVNETGVQRVTGDVVSPC